MKVTAIILAAGKGSRMQSEIKKQYMMIKERPVIWYSLNAFSESSVDEIVLVTGEEEIEYCRKIVEDNAFKKVKHIVKGGKERYNSVYEGLLAAKDSSYVLIHDGARPAISIPVIEKCIEYVKKSGACIIGVPVKDTIKVIDDKGYVVNTPARETLWSIQTPQAFSYEIIMNAYKKMFDGNSVSVTDDSMIVELYTGTKVEIVEGEYTNIKITTKEDIITAENFL